MTGSQRQSVCCRLFALSNNSPGSMWLCVSSSQSLPIRLGSSGRVGTCDLGLEAVALPLSHHCSVEPCCQLLLRNNWCLLVFISVLERLVEWSTVFLGLNWTCYHYTIKKKKMRLWDTQYTSDGRALTLLQQKEGKKTVLTRTYNYYCIVKESI